MMIVISPAKTLDFETPVKVQRHSIPEFLQESRKLVRLMRKYTVEDLRDLLAVSAKLAELNRQRFVAWKTPFTPDNAKQAVFAFKGDVYAGLQAETLAGADLAFAQQRLRVLSGLYGVLRPLDLIQAYRLEMGVRIPDLAGGDLYEFWGARIAQALNEQARELKTKYLINLASNEYFKVVRTDDLELEVISPVFKELKGGRYKIISFFAKKARGMMTRFILANRIKKPDGLKHFNVGGYTFNPDLSANGEPVFTRGTQTAA